MTQLVSKKYDGSTKDYLLNDINLQLMLVSNHIFLDKTKRPTALEAFLFISKNQLCQKPQLHILFTGNQPYSAKTPSFQCA